MTRSVFFFAWPEEPRSGEFKYYGWISSTVAPPIEQTVKQYTRGHPDETIETRKGASI